MKFFEKNNILVIRLTSMGDVILTTACLRNLRTAFPKARIDVVTTDSLREIFDYSPHINNLYLYQKNNTKFNLSLKKEIIDSLSNKKYDIVIDLQKNHRSQAFLSGMYEHKISYNKNRLAKLSLVYLKQNIFGNTISIPNEYFKTLAVLGVKDDGFGLELRMEKETETTYPPFQRTYSKYPNTVAIAPAAKHYTKQWIPERFAELCDLLHEKYNCKIILVGGDDAKEICTVIQNSSRANIINCSGASSILETVEKIDQADLLITNDSGVMHIGAARRVPIVAIFGSTSPEFGFGPYRTPNVIIETNTACRPCTHIGRSKCPKGHFNCMNKISAVNVFNACTQLLESL